MHPLPPAPHPRPPPRQEGGGGGETVELRLSGSSAALSYRPRQQRSAGHCRGRRPSVPTRYFAWSGADGFSYWHVFSALQISDASPIRELHMPWVVEFECQEMPPRALKRLAGDVE